MGSLGGPLTIITKGERIATASLRTGRGNDMFLGENWRFLCADPLFWLKVDTNAAFLQNAKGMRQSLPPGGRRSARAQRGFKGRMRNAGGDVVCYEM